MAAIVDAPVRSRRTLATGAAVFLAIYALTAAWIVLGDTGDPAPLNIEWTGDGDGLVVSGTVPTPGDRDELLTALGQITDASLIVSEVEIDPKAEPPDPIEQTARRLARSLPDGAG